MTVKMPAHLAILKPNAADEVRQEFGEVKHWYLAGHSLGGAMAGNYAAKHESELAGLIFWRRTRPGTSDASGALTLRE